MIGKYADIIYQKLIELSNKSKGTRLGMLLPITNDTDKIRIQKLGRNNKNRQEENRSIP
jgi:hypothetical protein